MRRECLVLWVSANDLLAGAYTELSDTAPWRFARNLYRHIRTYKPPEQG
jgi:hypothetical protein